MYAHKSRKLDDLKKAIRVEIAQIHTVILEREETDFQNRFEKSINEKGHRMLDVVFHT